MMRSMTSPAPRPLAASTLVALLILTLGALEMGIRWGITPPGNIQGLVSRYTQGEATPETSDVLLFGSCLPEQMLNLQDLTRSLAPNHSLKHLATATGTGLLWHVLLNSYVPAEAPTAAIFIPYGGTDLTRRNMPWESQLMEVATLQDLPGLMDLDCTTLSCRLQIAARSLSQTYRHRGYIAQGIWGRLGTGRLEKANRDAQYFQSWQDLRPEGADPYLYLRRFLALSQARGVRVIFTPLPSRDDLNPSGHGAQQRRRQQLEDARVVEGAGGEFRAFPRVAGLGPQHFEDDVHVNAQGRALLTEALEGALEGWLKVPESP